MVGAAGMRTLDCPFLGRKVELTEEREKHIAEHHPELLPAHEEYVVDTLASPDEVRRSSRFVNARLFSRWFPDFRGGKHVVVVVLTDLSEGRRNWVVTAYLARKLSEGETVWKRN
jgi:hypothetical protein